MHCPKCSTDNPAGNKFCAECGAGLARGCPHCGAEGAPEAKFCGACGSSLDASVSSPVAAAPAVEAPEVVGERRHLTILFCDLVGSVKLAAQVDPEEWRATVAGYQRAASEAITRFGGEVVRYVGDGIMAFFGYPLAHDNDAERAVRAGLAILDAIAELSQQPGRAKLEVRIGIDSGRVVVGAGTAGQAVDAFGDAANIAARVQAAGDPGTVMISDATQRLIAGLFVVEDRGAQSLKGITQPVQLYRVIRPSGMRGRFEAVSAAGGLTPFVGREDELRSLMSRWERTLEGDGQVALISGEAGIGKSRLVQRFHEQIKGTPHTWIEAGAGAFFQNTPFYPISEMLWQFIGEAPASDQIAALASRLTAVGLVPAEALPLIAPLLNLSLPPEYPPSPLSPEQQRRRLLATLVEWVLGSAHTQPLVSVIEDLHWVDPSTLELIQLLVEQGATAQLLLLYTARPEFRAPWAMRAHHMQITLNRLSARNVRTIVGEVAAQKALSDETIAAVVERTGGVPLFVEELTRAVLESGDGKLTGSAIPATLHDSLMARLDRLGPAKEVIQVGAVIGSDFSYALLHAVHPIAEADLQRALRSLTDAELLYVRGIAPEATYQFKHALIRDAAYEALLKSRRKELHRRIAECEESTYGDRVGEIVAELGEHYRLADVKDKAVEYFQLAAERASYRGAMVEAARHYALALGLLSESPETAARDRRELALQVSLGTALFGAKSWSHPEAHNAFTRAQELAEKLGETHQLIAILNGLWGSALTRGQVRASQELAQRMLRSAESSGDRGLLGASHASVGYVLAILGKLTEAQQHHELARSLFDENEAPEITPDPRIVSAASVLPITLHLGFPDRARQLVRHALDLAERNQNSYDVGFVRLHAAGVYLHIRDPQGLLETAAAMSALAKENPAYAGQADEHAAAALLMLGKREEAMASMRRAIASSEAVGLRIARTRELMFEAQFFVGAGRFAEALSKAAAALIETEEVATYRPWVLRLHGDLFVQSGAQASEIETAYRESLECARSQDNKWDELQSTTHFARWLKSRDRADEARTMLTEIYNWFTEGFDTPDLKEAKALLNELSI
ncbi:MAG: AAA family ATPase [Candidatus Binataceae bacterium]